MEQRREGLAFVYKWADAQPCEYFMLFELAAESVNVISPSLHTAAPNRQRQKVLIQNIIFSSCCN